MLPGNPVRLQKVDQFHTDIRKFTNPIPTNNFGATPAFNIKGGPAPTPQNNLALTATTVANPFIPINFSRPFFLHFLSDVTQPYNLNLFSQTLIPFNTFAPSARVTNFPPPSQAYNANLYTTTITAAPFIPVNFDRTYFPRPLINAIIQGTNQNIFTNPIPFGPYDYNRAVRIASIPFHSIARNALIFSEIPFIPVDYQLARQVPRYQIWSQPYTLAIYTFIAPVPFVQYDWSKPQRVGSSPPQAQPYNINIYINFIPFGPFDWSARPRLTPRNPPQPQPYNINIFVPPPPPPLPNNQYYWPATVPIKLSVTTVPQTNPNIFPPPPPIFGAQYRLLSDHYLVSGYTVAGSIITEGKEIPFGWPPSQAVDPLNAGAIRAFWNLGLQVITGDFFIYTTGPTIYRETQGVIPPITYWVAVPGQPNTYILTGPGAALGPKVI